MQRTVDSLTIGRKAAAAPVDRPDPAHGFYSPAPVQARPSPLSAARRALENARAARRSLAEPTVAAGAYVAAVKAGDLAVADSILAGAAAALEGFRADCFERDGWIASAAAALRAAEDAATAAAVDRHDPALAGRVRLAFDRVRHSLAIKSARGVRRFLDDLRPLAVALDLPDPDRTGSAALGHFASLWRPTAADRAALFGDDARDDRTLDAALYASGRWAGAATHDATIETGRRLVPDNTTIRRVSVCTVPADRPAGHVPRSAGYLAPVLPAVKPTIHRCPLTPAIEWSPIAPDWI